MDLKKRLELRRFIRELEQVRGRHTELVSVYVPAGFELQKVINQLQEEQGTAKNIKDARTRGNVIDSLEKVIRQLRLIQRTPVNGLAIFAGNTASQEGKVDIRAWSIEPPMPCKVRLYRCDQTFVIDVLKDMVEDKEVYGLIVMDRREATMGYLRGTLVQVVHHMTSGVPGKVKSGGQSAMRYHRITEGLALEFYRRISEYCNKEYLGKKELKGFLIGGPGPTKDEFIEQLNNELKKKIIAVQDLTYTDESGLNHLVDKSKDILAKEAIGEELKLMERFFTGLGKEDKKVVYGKQKVLEALEMGNAEIVMVSETMDDADLFTFEEKAALVGAALKVISIDTPEGRQFRDLGGVGAILRFVM